MKETKYYLLLSFFAFALTCGCGGNKPVPPDVKTPEAPTEISADMMPSSSK